MKNVKLTHLNREQFISELDKGGYKYVVYDTETGSSTQIELFKNLKRIAGDDVELNPTGVHKLFSKHVRLEDVVYKNGKTKTKQVNYYLPCVPELEDYLKTNYPFYFIEDKKISLSALKNLWGTFSSDPLNPMKGRVLNIQFGLFYFTENEIEIKLFTQSSIHLEEHYPLVKRVYESDKVPFMVGQNIQFDYRFTYAGMGLLPTHFTYDTKIIESLFNAGSDDTQSVSLSALCEKYNLQQYSKLSIDPTAVDWTNPTPTQEKYALYDVVATGLVFYEQYQNPEFKDLQQVLNQESYLQKILTHASIHGIPTDLNLVKKLLQVKTERNLELKETLVSKLQGMGWECPDYTTKYLNSKEFGDLIKSKLEQQTSEITGQREYFPSLGRKKTPGQPSIYMNKSFDLISDELLSILEMYWEYKSITKEISSYRTVLKDAHRSSKGTYTMHSVFGTTPSPSARESDGGTKSGRFSTTGYSLLNRSESDKQIHVAPPGYKIYTFDYSNIESRVAGSIFHDTELVNTFNEGRDQYREFASKVYHVPPESILKKSPERALAKEAVLAFTFFGSPWTLMSQLLISSKGKNKMFEDEATRLHETFWDTYPEMKHNAHQRWVNACASGYYKSTLGRKRKFSYQVLQQERDEHQKYGRQLYVPKYLKGNDGTIYYDPEILERASSKKFQGLKSNHEVQTTAGEGIKYAVGSIPFIERGWYLIGTIHDAIDILAPEAEEEAVLSLVPHYMLHCMASVLQCGNGLPIALEVEGSQGRCWARHNGKSFYLVEESGGYYQTPNYKWRLSYDEHGEKQVQRYAV